MNNLVISKVLVYLWFEPMPGSQIVFIHRFAWPLVNAPPLRLTIVFRITSVSARLSVLITL